MAQLLPLEELEDRIDCFGEFDRADEVCLAHCSLSFDCAAAREQYWQLQMYEDTLDGLSNSHSA
ncbi:MAG: hypothetical protein PVG03_17230 [Desulfarculaceae bacterium]